MRLWQSSIVIQLDRENPPYQRRIKWHIFIEQTWTPSLSPPLSIQWTDLTCCVWWRHTGNMDTRRRHLTLLNFKVTGRLTDRQRHVLPAITGCNCIMFWTTAITGCCSCVMLSLSLSLGSLQSPVVVAVSCLRPLQSPVVVAASCFGPLQSLVIVAVSCFALA